MKTEQVHKLHHHMKRQSVGCVTVEKKAVGGGECGSLQLRASTSRWAVVNSRYQVRIGCYQTFKAESIRLLLQQGEKRRCYQNLETLLIFFTVSLESTDWKQSHKPAQLASPSVILRRIWGILPSLHLSDALCILRCGSDWRWSSTCLSNAVSKYSVIAKDAASILRELMDTCAPQKQLCRAESLQCLVLSTFLWNLMFFFFYFSPSSAFRVYFVMISVCMCWHVWICEHACVCMWFHWDLRKHCW